MSVIITNDPMPFLERNGLVPTRRGPVMKLDLGANPINRYPMAPPLPQPQLVIGAVRPASPDSGTATVWPPEQ